MRTASRRSVRRVTDYAEQPADESLEIPEDLSALSDEDLTALRDRAVNAFTTLYGEGKDFSEEDLTTLASLTDGIEVLNAEIASRAEKAAERSEKAAELAARVAPVKEEDAEDEEDPEDSEDGDLKDEDSAEALPKDADAEEPEDETVTASGRGPIKVSMSRVSARARAHRPTSKGTGSRIKEVLSTTIDAAGFAAGQGVDWKELGTILDRRLAGFNPGAFSSAARAGRHLSEQNGLAVIRKEIPSEFQTGAGDPDSVTRAVRAATDEKRLPGGSLVASGGWCAPSETVYDLLELESRDGLISLPEIGISRGGIRYTLGPSFGDIYSNAGFTFTEQDDIDGKYAVDGSGTAVVGDKPCYTVECPDFTDLRLDVSGLCISAGLLQQRGYPEVIARTLRGALVAHDHKQSARYIARMVAGSTAVAMPAGQVGSTAPILTAIELQVEHYRAVNRLSRSTTLEAVFPFWVRGAIRSDLSRRLGVDLLAVTDAQIDAWFSLRGIAAQYVYDWQDIAATNGAAATVAWPTTVSFLLYAAGTWIKGGTDIITLDTIYDSVKLGQNNYTALFTEEGWLVGKFGFDSRVVSVPIEATGHTAGGVLIGNDGALKAEAPAAEAPAAEAPAAEAPAAEAPAAGA